MTALRRLHRAHPMLAGWIVALALSVRLLSPVGFMPSTAGGAFAIVPCAGMATPDASARDMADHHARPMSHHGAGHGDEGEAPERTETKPCAFAGLGFPALAAADPTPLPPLVAPRTAGPRLAVRRTLAALPRFRPPARAPPRATG